MTTTAPAGSGGSGIVARLLAKAEEYEQKAAAFRMVAAEMNGHKVEAKKNGFHRTLESAIKLRRATRAPEDEGASEMPAAAGEPLDTAAILLRYLEAHDGARVADLLTEVARHGETLTRDAVRYHLKKLPNVVRRGPFVSSTYHLVPTVQPRATQPRAKPVSKYARNLALAPARAEKARTVAAIVRDYGKPMPSAALVQAGKAAGIAHMRGLAAYVRKGYLKHKNGKYTFVAMPPADGNTARA